MSAMFHKKTALDKRLKKVRKEISSLDTSIRSLARSAEKDRQAPQRRAAAPREAEPPEPVAAPEPESVAVDSADELAAEDKRGQAARDERFASYLLARGFDTARPLRHERRIQRNKAIITSIFVLAVLLWVLFQYVL